MSLARFPQRNGAENLTAYHIKNSRNADIPQDITSLNADVFSSQIETQYRHSEELDLNK